MASLDLTTIRDRLIKLIEGNSWWSQFVGSQFVTMLATFIGQMVYRCQQFASASLIEGFISTATKRGSILAAAEDRTYVGSRVTPSTGKLLITNISTQTMTLPQYSTFLSDDQYPYLTDDIVTVPVGSSATVGLSQLEIVDIITAVDEEKEFYEVLLSRALTEVCYKIEVLITIDGVETKWTKSTQFRMATSTSKVYVEFYKPTDQLGIRFGDGTIGMIPPAGSTIKLKVWCSNGDITLLANQDLTPSNDSAFLADYITAKTSTSITGGTDIESIEATRNRAMYYLSYDNQVAWSEDYTYFLKRNIPATTWLSAWGEEEQEKLAGRMDLLFINRIFISGWFPGKTQAELRELIMKTLKNVPNPLNKRYVYVEAAEKPFTITITGEIPASLTSSVVIKSLKKDLEARFGKDSKHFDPEETGSYALIKVKDLWSFVDQLNYFSTFEIQVNDMQDSNGFNDFVYLDVENSIFPESEDN